MRIRARRLARRSPSRRRARVIPRVAASLHEHAIRPGRRRSCSMSTMPTRYGTWRPRRASPVARRTRTAAATLPSGAIGFPDELERVALEADGGERIAVCAAAGAGLEAQLALRTARARRARCRGGSAGRGRSRCRRGGRGAWTVPFGQRVRMIESPRGVAHCMTLRVANLARPGGAAQLAHHLDQVSVAEQVGFRQQSAVRVDRQRRVRSRPDSAM